MKTKVCKAICISLLMGAFLLYGGTSGLAQEKIKAPHMAFSLGSAAGGWTAIGTVIADNVNKKNFVGFPITPIPGAGGVGNPKRVSLGDSAVRLAFSYAPFLKCAVAGKPPYDKPYSNLKAVCGLITNVYHFIVAKKIDISTHAEIKEQKLPLKLGTGASGSTELFTTQALFKAMGVSLGDLKKWGGKVEQGSTSARSNLWKDRHINAWCSFINPPASAVAQVLAARPGKFVPVDKHLRDALVKQWGYVDIALPPGTYTGQDKPVPAVGLSIVVFARDDVSDEVIYRFTKTVAEMKDKLVKAYPTFDKWEPEGMCKGLGIDIHHGALKYYKERGWM